jgi:hypothetical protein
VAENSGKAMCWANLMRIVRTKRKLFVFDCFTG